MNKDLIILMKRIKCNELRLTAINQQLRILELKKAKLHKNIDKDNRDLLKGFNS